MNIFVLHKDPAIAAQMACDQHVVKMPTETAQMLSIIWQDQPVRPVGAYPPTTMHVKHPCTLWIGASTGNYAWAVAHGLALCDEHARRWPANRPHGARRTLLALQSPPDSVPVGPLGPFAQVMPDEYKRPDAIDAYRAFYLGDKVRFARWRKSSPPYWWPSEFY